MVTGRTPADAEQPRVDQIRVGYFGLVLPEEVLPGTAMVTGRTPADAERRSIRRALERRYGPSVPVTEEMVAAVASARQAAARRQQEGIERGACAGDGVTADGRRYRYSSAQGGYVFEEPPCAGEEPGAGGDGGVNQGG